MARSQQQELDFATPFRERMNELRARLRSVDVSVLSVSPLRWEQVMELVMAIGAHTQAGECRAPTAKVMATAGLTRRQYYTALAIAKDLGVVVSIRQYDTDVRHSDRLRLVIGRIDELVSESRRLRSGTNGNQREPTVNSGNQREPAGTTLKEHARANEELPNNSSTSTITSPKVRPAVVEEEVEEIFVEKLVRECRQKIPQLPRWLGDAIRQALARGCTHAELWARCKWWYEHRLEWPLEHRPGAFYTGLAEAEPGMKPSDGWPYR